MVKIEDKGWQDWVIITSTGKKQIQLNYHLVKNEHTQYQSDQ